MVIVDDENKDKNIEEIHFFVDAKSITTDFVADGSTYVPLKEKIKPKGDFYFINPKIELKDDDWVIYGVASTDNVDLVNDTIDVKEVFGDYLHEFINVGKIFYEHGYRFASQASKDNRIDEPIGLPYMVEIHDNKLWIYAVLDKSHPLAQKVWESMNSTNDPRFAQKWGFSIGAIRMGIPASSYDSKYGTIKKVPKMRLFEISVTPQPVNPYTWADVVKSFSVNSVSGEKAKFNKETVDEKLMKEKMPEVEFGDEQAQGSPPAEKQELDDTVVTKAVEDEEKGEDKAVEETTEEVKEDNAEEAPAPEEENQETEQKTEVDEDESEEVTEGKETAKEEGEKEEKEAGGENVLMELLGEAEKEGKEEEEEDLAADLLADKIDILDEKLEALTEKVNKLFDALTESVEERAEAGTENEALAASSVLEKSIDTLVDKLNEALDKLDLYGEEVKELKSLVAQIRTEVDVTKSLVTEKNTEPEFDVDKAREDFEEKPVIKSVNEAILENEEVSVEDEKHPVLKSVEAVIAGESDPLAKILTDKELQEAFIEVVDTYKSLEAQSAKMSPSEFEKKKNAILQTAQVVFGIDPITFKRLVN